MITGQRFAVEFKIDWFHAEGVARYYLYNGFFMYGSKTSGSAALEYGQPYIALDDKGIYINSTFMGGGTDFPIKKMPKMQLEKWDGESITFKRSTHSFLEYFRIDNLSVIYKNTEDESLIVPVSPSERRDLIRLLEALPISDGFSDKDDAVYSIELDGYDEGYTCIYVDGREIFQQLLEITEAKMAGNEKWQRNPENFS